MRPIKLYPNPDPSNPDYCPHCGRINWNLEDMCICGYDFTKDVILIPKIWVIVIGSFLIGILLASAFGINL